MRVKPLFPTPLIEAAIDDGALIAQLRDVIVERARTIESVQHSNVGGWQSAPDFQTWSGEPGAQLITIATAAVNEATGIFVQGELRRAAISWQVSAWANVNRAGSSNDLHFHPGAYWSACFYVDDGGIEGREALGGAIEFADPRGPLPLMYQPNVKMLFAGTVTAGLGERIYPKTGMLLVFPAWLGHSVTPYAGEATRISVAMNFAVRGTL